MNELLLYWVKKWAMNTVQEYSTHYRIDSSCPKTKFMCTIHCTILIFSTVITSISTDKIFNDLESNILHNRGKLPFGKIEDRLLKTDCMLTRPSIVKTLYHYTRSVHFLPSSFLHKYVRISRVLIRLRVRKQVKDVYRMSNDNKCEYNDRVCTSINVKQNDA